jgi:hypothetical protein
LTEDEFRRGPAENRLRRVVDEIKAILAEVAAVPYLAPARRDPLRLATLDLLEVSRRLGRAVLEAAHRAPGPEDL